MKTLKDIPQLEGKKVIVRVDFNVPLDESGNVKNDKRIRFSLPTIQYLLDHKVAQIILITHVGRPKNNESNLKTDKIAEALSRLINQPVKKVDDWGESELPKDQVIMLENIRFHSAEKSKDESERDQFGKQLASLADYYLNDAFSNSHREHASMTSIPKFIPGFGSFGVQKEVDQITKAMSQPEKPLIAVIGGLKADKLPAIKNLLTTADSILVAGALAFTLLKAQGKEMGDSKIDDEGMSEMRDLVNEIKNHPKVYLPTDAIIANQFSASADHQSVSVDEIRVGWMALDIGPQTAGEYIAQLKKAKTILWFGPIGVFEMEPFSHGTRLIAQALAESEAATIVGGGDSAAAVESLGLEGKMSLVSTGGGASLQLIEGKKLPAIEILN